MEDHGLFDVIGLYCGTQINVEGHTLFAAVGLYCGIRINMENHTLFVVVGLLLWNKNKFGRSHFVCFRWILTVEQE